MIDTLALNGDMETLADIIGDDDKLRRIIIAFGGCSIYVPQTVQKKLKYASMREDFARYTGAGASNSEAIKLLAESYNLSTRRVRTIVYGA